MKFHLHDTVAQKEERLQQLKGVENEIEKRRRARLLEARRRLMKNNTEYPLPQDEIKLQSLESDSVTALQKMVRGIQQRKKHRMFKKVCNIGYQNNCPN